MVARGTLARPLNSMLSSIRLGSGKGVDCRFILPYYHTTNKNHSFLSALLAPRELGTEQYRSVAPRDYRYFEMHFLNSFRRDLSVQVFLHANAPTQGDIKRTAPSKLPKTSVDCWVAVQRWVVPCRNTYLISLPTPCPTRHTREQPHLYPDLLHSPTSNTGLLTHTPSPFARPLPPLPQRRPHPHQVLLSRRA